MANARDFDDAVYCETNPDSSFTLSVAIADVAIILHKHIWMMMHFGRGTSIYFPTSSADVARKAIEWALFAKS